MNDPARLRLARWIAGQHAAKLTVTAVVDDSPGWSRFAGLPNDRELAEMQELYTDALVAWRKNPIAKRIVDITADYTIGDGISISSSHEPLSQFVDKFWFHPKNNMPLRLETMSDELARAGDLFPVLFKNPHDGMSYLRFVIKKQIVGIQTAANDWETELTYSEAPQSFDQDPVVWYSAQHPDAASQTAIMLHYHINRPLGALLGEGDLASMIPWLLRYSRMLEDRVRLHWGARAFLWDVTVPSQKVQDKQSQYANPPEPGSIIIHDESESWEAKTPNLRGADASHDMQAVRGMIDAGSGFPPHWRGEAANANLATATAMQGPAERHLKRRQKYVIYMLQDICTTAYLRQTNSPLPTLDYRELFTTAVPEVSRDDNLQLAQAANELTQSLTQLIQESEPKSKTLLRAYLEYIFKFMGEPQNSTTLDTMIDEIFKNSSKEANKDAAK